MKAYKSSIGDYLYASVLLEVCIVNRNLKKMAISDRLKTVISHKAMNAKQFAKACNIPYTTFQNYLQETRKISTDAMEKLHSAMQVNVNWLLTGDGEMFLTQEKKTENEDITTHERVLIVMFRDLPNDDKQKVSNVINELWLAQKDSKKN